MGERQVVVIGAGPAGVGSALALKDRGIDPVILERAGQIAPAWRGRYDRLRLNSSRQTSHLPGRRYPRGTPKFPTRDQVVEHIEKSARESGLEIRFGSNVERIDRANGGWTIETADGGVDARQIVLATGYEAHPEIPAWPGRERFRGKLLHSSQYLNPGPFAGKNVLVVGPGCSGIEIAHDLSEGGAGKIWLAVRTPPSIIGREGPGGIPGEWIGIALLRFPTRFADAFARAGSKADFGDLTEHGLPIPSEGFMTRYRRDGTVPTIVDKEVIDAVKQRKIEVVRAVESLDESGARLDDGSRLEPDAIICATGFRRGLEQLVEHLGVLDERGLPRAAAPAPAAHGLRFVGYTSRPGALGYMAKQARRSARAIVGELSSAREVQIGD